MRGSSWAAMWFTVLAGCGATPPPHTTDDDCDPARERAGSAWARVAEVASATGGGAETPGTPIDAAVTRLEAHLAALRDNPEEVEPEVALEISGVVMDAIDELGSDLPASLRERCNDAAEALLTDRGVEGSQRAARGALAALEGALTASRPDAAANRDTDRDLTSLTHRARDAADAYAEDVRLGDRRADRAEAALIPERAAAEIVLARTEAIDASRAARDACGFARRLSAPSL